MFELKQSLCYPGFQSRACEDIVGVGKNYCFVMDGASGLSGKNIVDPVSDSAWMVKKVCRALQDLLDAGDDRPTGDLLREVFAPVRQEYIAALQSRGETAPQDSPSAGFALFRQRKGALEFFGMGDCVGVAKLPDGRNFYALDHDLPNLDHQVLERMMQLHENTGISMAEAKKACNDLLLYNRNLRNRPGGYWILDLLTDEGIDHAHQERWELKEPVRIGAFSDGFAQLCEVFGVYRGYTPLFAAMQETDLEEMFRDLCRLQDADPDCNRYPRFKRRDDTCALWGVFIPE